MMKVFSRLWADEAGYVLSSESVLIATVVVIGLLSGLTSVRDQVVQELGDVALAIAALNQSYEYGSITVDGAGSDSMIALTAGSDFDDKTDVNDGADSAGAEPAGINLNASSSETSEGGT